MENYILITTLVLLAGIIYLVFSKRKNNDAEINELKESLTKVLVKMEEDNKQLRQNYIDEKINMEKLVLGIVKENTASQEKSFKTESELKFFGRIIGIFNDFDNFISDEKISSSPISLFLAIESITSH